MKKENSPRNMIFPIITEETLRLPFYVTGVGSLTNQHPVLRPHGLPNYQILYITSGNGHLRIDNEEFDITANMGFFFEPGVPHEYYAEEEPWTSWWVTFSGYAIKDFSAISGLGRYLVFHVHEMERLKLLHNDIYSSAECAGLLAATDSSYHLYKFLLELNCCIGTEAQKFKKSRSKQLQSVLMYLENHFDIDITLTDMANLAGVSPQHLCRLFKQEFNMRPFEYLVRCRLQNAKELLIGVDNLTLKEIASKTGFNDVSYFCCVFKQFEGMTPVEFRRMYREY